jgi:hypothetical protein
MQFEQKKSSREKKKNRERKEKQRKKKGKRNLKDEFEYSYYKFLQSKFGPVAS